MTNPMHADRPTFTLKVWPAWPRLAADRQPNRRLLVQMRMSAYQGALRNYA